MKAKRLYGFGCLVIAVAALFPGSAHAAIQLVGMTDFNFGTWSGSGAISVSDSVCVWENNGTPLYRVTARGSGTGGAFTMTGGTTTLPYSVTWIDSRNVNTLLTAGVRTVQIGNSSNVANCGGATNATIRIDITQTDLLASEAATYTGVLTVILNRN